MWSWTEMLTIFYRSRARAVWIPLRISTEICRLGEGRVCAHGDADYLLENISCEDHENGVNWKLEHPDDIFFSVLALRIRVFLYKIAFWPNLLFGFQQQGAPTLPDIWFPPPLLRLACVPIVETRFLELAVSLLDFSPWIPLDICSFLLRNTQDSE